MHEALCACQFKYILCETKRSELDQTHIVEGNFRNFLLMLSARFLCEGNVVCNALSLGELLL